MDVIVNGRTVTTSAHSVSELVADQAFSGQKVATALNGQFVAESRRATTALNPGDRVEIVSARQGG